MNPKERSLLLESATTAYRPLGARGEVAASPAFHDLDEAGRLELHAELERLRRLEAALDPAGLSTTGRAVMARIGRQGP